MKRSQTKPKTKRQKTQTIEDIDAINDRITEEAEKCDLTNHTPIKRHAVIKSSNNSITTSVFTKEQELALRDHIIKCCKTQYGITNTTIRKITYEYALKLPDCKYPEEWDNNEMAGISWYVNFKSRYPGLKKALTKKFEHRCICIMGCHMGPEGKKALKKLEAKMLIARVYHYLQKEYEYMKICNDLGFLVNILRRTAEATGVCEQTITNILDEEKRNTIGFNDIIPVPKESKNEECIMKEHNYSNGGESSKVETVDEDSSNANNVKYSDFERLQQGTALIKSVTVEILDDEEEQGDKHANKTDSMTSEPKPTETDSSEPIDKDEHEVKKNSTEIKHELDEEFLPEKNKIRIVFQDGDEPDIPPDVEDTAIRIDSEDMQLTKPDNCDTLKDTTIRSSDSGEFDGELVIDESQLNIDNLIDRLEESIPADGKTDRIDGDVICIDLNRRSPEDNDTIPVDKHQHSMEICHDKLPTVVEVASCSAKVTDNMTT